MHTLRIGALGTHLPEPAYGTHIWYCCVSTCIIAS